MCRKWEQPIRGHVDIKIWLAAMDGGMFTSPLFLLRKAEDQGVDASRCQKYPLIEKNSFIYFPKI